MTYSTVSAFLPFFAFTFAMGVESIVLHESVVTARAMCTHTHTCRRGLFIIDHYT